MPDRHPINAAIERVVAGARIPGRAKRDDLRRELESHFESIGESPEDVQDALRRFGTEASVIDALQHVYRWDRFALHLVKVAASIVACVAAALIIQVAVNLRVELAAEAWRLGPEFSRTAGLSIAVVLGLITAWEAARTPFSRTRCLTAIATYGVVCLGVRLLFVPDAGAFATAVMLVVVGFICSKLEARPRRLILLVGAFAAALYVNHYLLHVTFGPVKALRAGAVLTAVWTSTVVILARVDHVFLRVFDTTT